MPYSQSRIMKRKIIKYLRHPLFHIILLTSVTAFSFSQTTIHPMDDHFLYQNFMKELINGKFDLSITGYHGASFLAFPIYLLTRSDLSNIYFQIFCALLLVPAMYAAVKVLFEDKFLALLGAYAMAMMPFYSYIAFRGFTFPSYTLLILLAIALYGRGSKWAFLPLSFAIITKPFAIALFPLFLLWKNKKQEWIFSRGLNQVLLACVVPAIYVLIQLFQTGAIAAAANPEITATNVFHPLRFPLNAAHSVQVLFSVHNFYFLDPVLTRMSNMVHSSPLLMIFGIFTLMYPAMFFRDRSLWRALGSSFVCAFLLATMLDHIDNAYMQTSVLILAISSLPFLKKFPLWIPFVLATLHFQWLYAYLEYKEAYSLNYSFFVVPLIVDVVFVLFCAFKYKLVLQIITDRK
jgi:hypothetical protein